MAAMAQTVSLCVFSYNSASLREQRNKRSADQRLQRLANDPVPALTGLLLNRPHLSVYAFHIVAHGGLLFAMTALDIAIESSASYLFSTSSMRCFKLTISCSLSFTFKMGSSFVIFPYPSRGSDTPIPCHMPQTTFRTMQRPLLS